MSASVQKWGNSLAIRLPKAIAEQVNLETGSKIEFDTSNGVLTVRPLRPRRRSKYKLADLLKGWKGPSPYRYFDRYPPVGKEIL